MNIIFVSLVVVSLCGVRHNRTLENPQDIIPNAKIVNNIFGGHDYYVKGRKVAYSMKNKNGSYDIYVKGKLKYSGAKYTNTNKTIYNSRRSVVNKANTHTRPANIAKKKHFFYNDKPYYMSDNQRRNFEKRQSRAARDAKLEAWKAKKKKEYEQNCVKAWDFWHRK